MTDTGEPAPDHRTLEQAAEWFAILNDDGVSVAEREAWRHWLQASPLHRRAWGYVEAVGRRFGRLREEDPAGQGVRALDSVREQRLSRRAALKSLLLVAGIGGLGWAGWQGTPVPGIARRWRADYRTAVGEVAALRLDDGTRLWLNTDSALNVDYDSEQRLLTLVAGEVLVQTAPDPGSRPLRVVTDDGAVQALGTRFTVRRTAAHTDLAVFEGAVRISPLSGARPVRLPAGQGTRFTAEAVAPARAADPGAQAWSQGLLLADERPLSELLAELGRYRHGHLGVDPRVADLKVMGAYPLRDTDRALAMLERSLPVTVRRILPWWVTVSPRG